MWLSAIKLAIQTGSHIYKQKQNTKMLMADAEQRHAAKLAAGEIEFDSGEQSAQSIEKPANH